ncbi:hypothetical protein BST61_g4038 [Cercospora zeina]
MDNTQLIYKICARISAPAHSCDVELNFTPTQDLQDSNDDEAIIINRWSLPKMMEFDSFVIIRLDSTNLW